jgi:recombination protein RecA
VKRVKLNKSNGGGNYFSRRQEGVKFFSTGCTILDCAMGGGWAEERVANIVGDKSTGKTLLCIEASANFAIKYPKGKGFIYYRECEDAFDDQYAAALGMPLDQVDRGEPIFTIEEFYNDLANVCAKHKRIRKPGLYIVDSLDALSDDAEMKREINKGAYGAAGKAKQMSALFRRIRKVMKGSRVTLLIVSQVRDRIGVTFGDKQTRACSHALDFYSSHVIWLTQLKRIVKTYRKIKRPTGVLVRAQVKKNKVALPFREAQFAIKFAFGTDDEMACVDWLESIGMKEKDMPADLKELQALVWKKWYEVETTFLPKEKKYA